MKLNKLLLISALFKSTLIASTTTQNILNEHTIFLKKSDTYVGYTKNEPIDGTTKTSTINIANPSATDLVSQVNTAEYQARSALHFLLTNTVQTLLKNKFSNLYIFKTGQGEEAYDTHTSKHAISAHSNNDPIITRDKLTKLNLPIYSKLSLDHLKTIQNNIEQDDSFFYNTIKTADNIMINQPDNIKSLYSFLRTLSYSTNINVQEQSSYINKTNNHSIKRYIFDYTDILLPNWNNKNIRHRFVCDYDTETNEYNIVTHYPYLDRNPLQSIQTGFFFKNIDPFVTIGIKQISRVLNFDNCIKETLPFDISTYTYDQKLKIVKDTWNTLRLINTLRTNKKPLSDYLNDYVANFAKIFKNMTLVYNEIDRANFMSIEQAFVVYFSIEDFIDNNKYIEYTDTILELYQDQLVSSINALQDIKVSQLNLDSNELKKMFKNATNHNLQNTNALKTLYIKTHKNLLFELLYLSDIFGNALDKNLHNSVYAINEVLGEYFDKNPTNDNYEKLTKPTSKNSTSKRVPSQQVKTMTLPNGKIITQRTTGKKKFGKR